MQIVENEWMREQKHDDEVWEGQIAWVEGKSHFYF